MRQIHSIRHNIMRSVYWYGKNYTFYRPYEDEYREPTDINPPVQTVKGIYHASGREFVNLIAGDGATIAAKNNKGILCADGIKLEIKQGDIVYIADTEYHVTNVDSILYDDEIIAQEISIEEVIKE